MIAPSKLGQLIAEQWSSEEELIRRLREAGLVQKDVTRKGRKWAAPLTSLKLRDDGAPRWWMFWKS